MIPVDSLWTFRADDQAVIDGDTLDVIIDCGFRATRTERLRLLGVNAPERHGDTKKAGDAARAYVVDWLSWTAGGQWPLIIQTRKSDAFGRYLAKVWRTVDGHCLNDDLLAAGHAVAFMVDSPAAEMGDTPEAPPRLIVGKPDAPHFTIGKLPAEPPAHT